MYIQVFSHFLIELFATELYKFLLDINSLSTIWFACYTFLDINSLLTIWFAGIFSHSTGFYFVTVSRFGSLSSCLFWCLCFWSHIQKVIAKSHIKEFLSCFLPEVSWFQVLHLSHVPTSS